MLVLYLGSPSFLATLHAIGRRNKSVPNNSLEICFYSLVCFRSPSLDVKQHIYRGSYNLVVVLFHYFFLGFDLFTFLPPLCPPLFVGTRSGVNIESTFFFSGASLSSPLSVFFASILSAMKSRSRCCCSLPFMTSSFLLYCCQHQRLN